MTPIDKIPSDEKPKAKRFWKETHLKEGDNGYIITLDGREVKTPQGSAMRVPQRPLAEAICKEWDDQQQEINPEAMPMFKFTVTAIDRVTPQRAAIVHELANYGANDLLCYREENDQRLSAHQHQSWQPYLDWLEQTHAITLKVFSGIMPGDQAQDMKNAMVNLVDRHDDFALAGLHTMVTCSGSLVLGLAAKEKLHPIDTIFEAAFLDDLWQQEKWGYDAETDQRLKNHQLLLQHAHQYLEML